MSVNKVILVGNVGKDPEVRYYDGGMAVATFSLATTERGYTLANGTQVPERTDWHNIVLWGAQAQFAEKYIHKGDKLYVEGKIRTRQYDDQNGVRRYVTEINGVSVELMSRPAGEHPAAQPTPAQQAAQQQAQAQQAAQAVQNLQAGKPVEDTHEDLPF
jgi:single-strand DNA-binding protein